MKKWALLLIVVCVPATVGEEFSLLDYLEVTALPYETSAIPVTPNTLFVDQPPADFGYSEDAVRLSFSDSCNDEFTSNAIYAGFLGEWNSHLRVSCFTTTNIHVIEGFPDDVYFLIVSMTETHEGLYGYGVNRLPSAQPCAPQTSENCR